MSLPRLTQIGVNRAEDAARDYINQSVTAAGRLASPAPVLNLLSTARAAVLTFPASNPAVAQTVTRLDSLQAGVQQAAQLANSTTASAASLLTQQQPNAGRIASGTIVRPRQTAPTEDSAAQPTRPLTSTQATGTQPGAGTLVPDSAGTAALSPVATPATSPGVGAPDDDGTPNLQNAVQREINTFFGGDRIVPQPNVLDQYASYTYSISFYAMTLESFNAMVRTRTVTLDGKFLLFQSGGAPVLGRNEFFSNDYYIDSLELKTVVLGKGTRTSHNINEVVMTVIEPNGLSLIENLASVNIALNGANGNERQARGNWGADNYLMVLRFYGYDDNGNLVKVSNPTPNGTTDSNAVVEKFYPIKIATIEYDIDAKLIEYRITGTSPVYETAASTNRGTVPYSMELSGQTVEQVLAGSSSQTAADPGREGRDRGLAASTPPAVDQGREGRDRGLTPPAPPTATSAPPVTITGRKGLFEALNQIQQDNYKLGRCSIADQYEIEFVGSSIKDAKINTNNAATLAKSATPMSAPVTSRDAVLGEVSAIDPRGRTVSIMSGKQIVQVLEEVIRNSSYIKSQQLSIVAEGGADPGKINLGARSRNLAWFKISFTAIPLGFDTIRNTIAYRMKFVVSPYQIYSAPLPWFLPPEFRGVHKEYEYIFTGQNKSVIEYRKQYKTNFSQIMSGATTEFLARETANFNYLQTYVPAPRSGQSSQGAQGAVNEGSANLADYLYAIGETDSIEMTIVGDPAWLQQGEAFVGNAADRWDFRPFNADGTINFESGQVLLNFSFNRPVDYDIQTGLMDPGSRNFGADRRQGIPGLARQSFVYSVSEVTNNFVKGKFTQEIKGQLIVFPSPEGAARIANAPTSQITPQQLSTPQYSPFGPVPNPLPTIVDSPFSALPTSAAPPPGLVTSNGQIVGGLSGRLAVPPTIGAVGTSLSTVGAFGPVISPVPPQQIALSDDHIQRAVNRTATGVIRSPRLPAAR
jgi:hypothetical protein